jgi:hypothetical protein
MSECFLGKKKCILEIHYIPKIVFLYCYALAYAVFLPACTKDTLGTKMTSMIEYGFATNTCTIQTVGIRRVWMNQ